MATERSVLIAGGGIGGLAAALALARAGSLVTVFERNPSASEVGAGIQLGPNAVQVLRLLGVDAAVRASAAVPDAVSVHSGAGGAEVARIPLGETIARRHDAPYWVVHRADLHKALAEAASVNSRIELCYGRPVSGLLPEGATGVVFADGSNARGKAVVGADGVTSRVRPAIGALDLPQPSGYVAYRTIIEPTAVPMLDPRVVGAWLSPRAHVVHYPVRAGEAMNIVVIARSTWRGDGWQSPADLVDVRDAVQDCAAPIRQAINAAPAWLRWWLAEPVRLARWTCGPVALLGDAAHATFPFLAQGGAMALEDAAVLAACAKANSDDLSRAFTQYAAIRGSRAALIQDASSRNGRIFHLDGVAAMARDAALRLMPQSLQLSRLDWVYGWKPPAG